MLWFKSIDIHNLLYELLYLLNHKIHEFSIMKSLAPNLLQIAC